AAARRAALGWEARHVRAQVNQLIAVPLHASELRSGLSAETRRRLDAATAAARTVGRLEIRLWNRDGTLLYSTRGAVVRRAPLSAALRAALGPEAAVVLPAEARAFTATTLYLSLEGYLRYLAYREHQIWLAAAVQEASPERVIAAADEDGTARFYIPLPAAGSPTRPGAYELTYDGAALEARVASLQRGVWTAVPSSTLALYGLLLLVAQRAAPPRRRREDRSAVHAGFFRTLARVVDARDEGTGDHSGRVASYAVAIGRRLGLSDDALAELRMAAGLHDIGKISVPDAVLKKPGPLTAEEWSLMRRHAVVGSRILDGSPFADRVKSGVRHVHEWWNGRGYPDRLKGEQIPLFGRILAVADAFEAMTSRRPYRRALSVVVALAELERMRGVQFDPTIVDVFAAWVREGPPSEP
ncbi:MAG TPA: HD-GYP domain-containing protein, partial [bacterium]|nr:HD-GYP domain-containing protein [bacterium]